MNFQMSREALIAMGCVAGLVVFSLVILWGVWRRGIHSEQRTPPAEKGEAPSFNGTWKKEDALFAELARKAEDLRTQSQEESDEKNS